MTVGDLLEILMDCRFPKGYHVVLDNSWVVNGTVKYIFVNDEERVIVLSDVPSVKYVCKNTKYIRVFKVGEGVLEYGKR